MAVELDVEALTPNQAARRQRVIDAAMKLAADGGYDTVQMRDVASEAGVALGTIYRYFASKDHLLAACQVAFARAEQRRLELRPTEGDTAADRVVDVLRRATRAQERQPQLTAAMVTARSRRLRLPARSDRRHGGRARPADGRHRPTAQG